MIQIFSPRLIRWAERFLLALFVAFTVQTPTWAGEPTEDAVLATLPFERPSEARRVYINLAPEGRPPFIMLLDTGAAISVITPRMARKMHISVRKGKSSPYRRKTVLGRDLQFWVDTRHSDTSSRTGWEYGLLGGDFLDDYVVEIDFPGRVVRFLDPKKYEVPKTTDAPGTNIVAMRWAGTRISVPIELNGQQTPVLLDTGAPSGLILSGKAFRGLGLDEDELVGSVQLGTTVGKTTAKRFKATDFRFGDFGFPPFEILVAPRGFYNIAGATDSLLGYGVLSHFVMRIDYKRKRIWLKRPSAAAAKSARAASTRPTS